MVPAVYGVSFEGVFLVSLGNSTRNEEMTSCRRSELASLRQAPAVADHPGHGAEGDGGDPCLPAQRGGSERLGAESQGLAAGCGGPAGRSKRPEGVSVSVESKNGKSVQGAVLGFTAQTRCLDGPSY